MNDLIIRPNTQLSVAPEIANERERIVEDGFWTKVRRTAGKVPFLQDAVAGYYCAVDPAAPAKVKAMLPWSSGHWDGFVEGEFRTRDASGFADARLGLDVLLVGAPVLEPANFSSYEQKSVVGLRFDLVMPTGEYDPLKSINLGSNRWAFHSELGWSKAIGKWTLEVAGGFWVYTDNRDFYGGNTLAQDPFFVAKVNFIRSVRPGLWWAVGTGYGQGGQTFVNGLPRDTKQKNWRLTAMVVFPLSPTQGLSLTVASGRTFQAGPDFDVVALAYQIAWN